MADILQHPSAPVQFNPPLTPESVRHAIAACQAERAAAGFTDMPEDVLTDDDCARLEAVEVLSRLVDQHGVPRVQTWLRFVAGLHGQDVDRPTHLCLACGGSLSAARCATVRTR